MKDVLSGWLIYGVMVSYWMDYDNVFYSFGFYNNRQARLDVGNCEWDVNLMINSKQILSVILLKPIQNLIIYSNITDLSYSSVTFLSQPHRIQLQSLIFITMSSPKP